MINLTNCDIEPIHHLGHIQSHGYIIAIDLDTDVIKYLSANFSEIVHSSSGELLGRNLFELDSEIENDQASKEWIRSIQDAFSKLKDGAKSNVSEAAVEDKPRYLISHTNEGLGIIEIEDKVSNEQLFKKVSALNDLVAGAESLDVLFRETVKEIRKLIDFDRVMVYKFLKDDSGTVVAESSRDGEMHYLGLRFPESDIPKQARNLYIQNRVRFISDAKSEDIIINGLDKTPIDLTNSVLRSVSKMHIQYLANMGVQSSFSISIIYDGKLWGLIACHNATQKHIDYQVRNVTRFVADYIGNYIRLDAENRQSKRRAEAFENCQRLTRRVEEADSVAEGLLKKDFSIMDYIPSVGAATFIGGTLRTVGRTPELSVVKQIIKLSANGEIFWETDNLSEFGLDLGTKNRIAGCLLMNLSDDQNNVVIWFRDEVVYEVEWAGEPVKQFVNKEIDGLSFTEINPRKSFETWKQSVRNTSSPWTAGDIAKAELLRDNINLISLKRNVELERNNVQLQRAYSEMDNFMNSVSHDLNNPLSVINLNAQFALRKETDEAIREKMNGIVQQVAKISNMLAQFRELSKSVVKEEKVKEIEMPILIFEIFEEQIPRYGASNIVREYGELYNITGNEVAVYQIFSNIISNAIKYSSHKKEPIVRVESTKSANFVQYRIYDNGIGIGQDSKDIFEAFERLDPAKRFEGSGIGLSIVKNLVIRQNASINYISCENEGTCFYITFYKRI